MMKPVKTKGIFENQGEFQCVDTSPWDTDLKEGFHHEYVIVTQTPFILSTNEGIEKLRGLLPSFGVVGENVVKELASVLGVEL